MIQSSVGMPTTEQPFEALPTPRVTVSVAMATYNGAKYIREQLDSIAEQSVLPDELVITDDTSTDTTIEIIRSFQAAAPFPVKIIENQIRLGWRKNFIEAALNCSGEIIFFCDQDDIWLPNKIEVIKKKFEKPNILMAYHKAALIDSKGAEYGMLHHQNAENPWQPPNGMLMAFHRSLLLRRDLIDETSDFYNAGFQLAHDQWIPLLAQAFGSVAVSDDKLAQYRQHENNVFGADQPHLTRFQKLRRKIKDRSAAFPVLAETSSSYAGIFGKFLQDPGLSHTWRQKALDRKLAFEELSRLYAVRAEIYRATTLWSRFAALLRLIEMKGYIGTDHWYFTRRAFVRDFLLGVMFGSLIRKLSTQKVMGDANCRYIVRT